MQWQLQLCFGSCSCENALLYRGHQGHLRL